MRNKSPEAKNRKTNINISGVTAFTVVSLREYQIKKEYPRDNNAHSGNAIARSATVLVAVSR
jgi:hypothetical protein